jgi:hypothetical protein
MPRAYSLKICAALLFAFILQAPAWTAQQSPTPVNPPAPVNPPPPKQEEDIELNTVLMESTFMIQGQSLSGKEMEVEEEGYSVYWRCAKVGLAKRNDPSLGTRRRARQD